VIPADRKWFARVAAGAVIADALIRLDPQYPDVGEEAKAALQEARVALAAEGGDPALGQGASRSAATSAKPKGKSPSGKAKRARA
jgi:hypothetical protein